MKYCVKCGAQLDDDARFCTSCATPVPPVAPDPSQQPYGQPYQQPYGQPYQQPYQQYPYGQYPYQYPPQYGYPPYYDDAPSTGMMVLGFFFPFVGLILFLVWHDQKPLKAKSVGKGALVGAIAGVALPFVLIFLFLFLGLVFA